MAKSRCETCGLWFEDEELDDHLSLHLDEPTQEPGEQAPVRCPDCGVHTEVFHGMPFKVGTSDPATRLLFGWRSDDIFPIDLYVCPKCGRIQLFVSKKDSE